MGDPYHLIIAPEAAADIAAIHAYIAQDSPDNAAKMVERILQCIDLLKTAPHRFALAHQNRKLRHPVRSLPVPPYVVFFRLVDETRTVRILTIRHGARRRPRRLD